jgi:hypothetical protein
MESVRQEKRGRILRLSESQALYALLERACGLPSALDRIPGLASIEAVCRLLDGRVGIKVFHPDFAPVPEGDLYPDL